MNSKGKYAVLLLSSVLVIYAIVGGMLGSVLHVSAQNGSIHQLSVFNEVLNHVISDYVDAPSMKSAFTGAVRGLIESVDPYGGYLTPTEVTFYKTFDQEKSVGIGAVLARRFGYPIIVSVLPGGPAEKAGLGTNDVIESIEGVTTREMNLVQVNSLLASQPGKPVSLSVIRRTRGEPEVISVGRDVFHVPTVQSKMIESNIAYTRVPYLGPGKAAEAKRQLDGLLKSGATSVILDLRASTGTNEQEAVGLASLFVDSGSVGFLQGQTVEKKLIPVDPSGNLTKVPLVILVNQGTAGNTELVAAAVSGNKRGQLVGMRTFGSGSVQKLIPMEDGYALLLSVAKYFTPGGKEIQEIGITPDIEIGAVSDDQPAEVTVGEAPKPDQPKVEEDRQLKKAIEVLRNPAAALKGAA